MKAKNEKSKRRGASDRVEIGKGSFRLEELEMGRFLTALEGKATPATARDHATWSLKRKYVLKDIDKAGLVEKLARKGIVSPATLATMAIEKEDPTRLARYLGLTERQVVSLCHHALQYLPEDKRRSLEFETLKEKATGALVEGTPEYKAHFADRNLGNIRRLSPEELKPMPWVLPLPYVPKAVDYRADFGPARDQNPRGSCYAFAATAVREFHENIRAGRGDKIDLSEEYVFWYSKKGQRLTSGGGDGIGTLRDFAQSGACKESYWPYIPKNVPHNHAHVPAPTEAIDNAPFYRGGEVVYLQARSVEDVKAALRKGKVVVIHTKVGGWNHGTGEVQVPGPGDDFGPINHAVTIVGFVDSDSVPAEWEGGYFIVRNSWGDPHGLNNVMGPEYGGHLRMPYAYYKQCTGGAGTTADDETVGLSSKKWLAEYYLNKNLEGTPFIEREVDQISFEWGYEGPLTDWWNDLFGDWLPASFDEDYFSARWTTVRFLRGGWYHFETISDDGIRVWIDDRLVINAWHPHPATHVEKDFYVPEGIRVIRVEYFEKTGVATAKFSFTPISLAYKVYSNNSLQGSPTYTFEHSDLAWEWRHVPPLAAVDDQFSVTAEGSLKFSEEEAAIFHALASGGIRVYLDGSLVIDAWDSLGGEHQSDPVMITTGEHQFKVAFRNRVTMPNPDENRIFRSYFQVNWYHAKWDVKVYHDAERQALHSRPDQERLADHQYQLTQGRGLSGHPLGHKKLDHLSFPDKEAIKTTFEGTDDFPLDWISMIAHRKIVSQGRRHRFRLRADDGFRLIVDGRCFLDSHHILGTDSYDVEVDLMPGVHDFCVEYYQSAWGAVLQFSDQSQNMWRAKWYNNRDLSGTPVYIGQVDKIDFDWGVNGPGVPGIGHNNFSVEFSTAVVLRRGRYRFVARSDDGVRLYVDGVKVIDSWYDRGARTDVVELDILGGGTSIRVEYYEHGGSARLLLDYYPIGFLGEYYKGTDLGRDANNKQAEPPYLYRYEPTINFDWSSGSPDPRFARDNYSAQWSGWIELPAGRYEVKTTTDDGVRVLIDGRIAIQRWKDQSATAITKWLDFVERYHDVVLEYYEHKGVAECRLEFNRVL